MRPLRMSSSRYPTTTPETISLGFLHAMVVGGNVSRCQAIRDILGELGFEITTFSEGSAAIEALREEPPNLLLVVDDLQGHPSALDLVQWLGQQDSGDTVHTVVVCETADRSHAEEFLRHGASDLIDAGFTSAEITHRLQVAEYQSQFLRSRSAESQHLRQLAAQYRQIVEHWPQAAVLMPNLSRPIKEVNQRALEILGLNREEVVGKYLSLILPDLFERDDFIPYEDFSKNPRRVEDVLYETTEGNTPLEVRIVGMEWGEGGSVLVTFENVGRLQAIERHRRRISQVESVRRFASEMAHEFNNILTVVNGNLSILGAGTEELSPASMELIDSSRKACRRASDLVKRLTKHHDFGHEEVALLDPLPVIEKACDEAVLSPRAEINVRAEDDIWPVLGSASLLSQVVKALLKNADEAFPNSVIEIDIHNSLIGEEASLPLASGDYVRVEVLDHGPGMTPEVQDRAFEPFFTTRPEAEGLGLTQALKIMEDLGGTLQIIDSPTGGGTCLELHFPAHADQSLSVSDPDPNQQWQLKASLIEEDEAPTSSNTSNPFQAISEAPPRVLFMDDEPDIRTVVEKILTTHHFEVTTTSTGEQAVAAFYQAHQEGHPFDVLLLDLEVVGGMGGKDTIAVLRQEFPHVKAVVTTGYLDDSILANHRDHGFSGVLTKPFQMEDLVAMITMLGSKAAS